MCFQVYDRKVDLLLRRSSFTHLRYSQVDYLNSLGSSDKYPVSRQPREIPNYLTITNPFGNYIWLFIILTALTMSLALVTIDKCYSWWNEMNYKDIVYKSNILKLHYTLLSACKKIDTGNSIMILTGRTGLYSPFSPFLTIPVLNLLQPFERYEQVTVLLQAY